MISLREYAKQTDFIVTAHRGASGSEVENSRPAIIKALDLGVKVIEIDINITGDNSIIAFHDSEITINSEKANIHSLNFNEIKDSVPSLLNIDDVIDLVNDKAYLALELKSDSKNLHTQILNKITSKGLIDKTLFLSFFPLILKEIKDSEPNALIGFISNPYDTIMPDIISSIVDFDLFVCSMDEVRTEIIERAAAVKSFVGVYGVETSEQVDYLKSIGVKAIGSDFPERFTNNI